MDTPKNGSSPAHALAALLTFASDGRIKLHPSDPIMADAATINPDGIPLRLDEMDADNGARGLMAALAGTMSATVTMHPEWTGKSGTLWTLSRVDHNDGGTVNVALQVYPFLGTDKPAKVLMMGVTLAELVTAHGGPVLVAPRDPSDDEIRRMAESVSEGEALSMAIGKARPESDPIVLKTAEQAAEYQAAHFPAFAPSGEA